jgi:hypothetical protein
MQTTPTGKLANHLLPACQALFMSALVTMVAVAVNAPPGTVVIAVYGRAWAVTLPVAIVAAYVARPMASRLAEWLARRIAGK